MISEDTPLALKIGEQVRRFSTEERLKEFLGEWQKFWASFNFQDLPSPLNQADNDLVRFRKYSRHWDPYPTDKNVRALQERLQNMLNNLPAHTDIRSQIVKSIYDEYDRGVGAAAFLAMRCTGVSLSLQYPELVKGAIIYNARMAGFESGSASAVKATLAAASTEHERQYFEVLNKADRLRERTDELNARAAVAIENQAEWVKTRQSTFEEEVEERIDLKIAELEATEAAYREAMKLDRPRQYWTTKASGHRTKANKYRWRMFTSLGISGVIGLLGLGLLFWYAHNIILDNRDVEWPVTFFILLSGMGFVGVSILFWINRLIVRLFLSELHLAMDAEERVTMIESYLALNAELDFPSEQREIVLQAIFRPTQDGIVKDDASGDPNVTAWLSRAP